MTVSFGNLVGDYGAGTLITVASAVGVVFAAAAVLAVVRIIKGPSILDRMIATDVLLATIACALGSFAAVTGRTDVLPVMLVIAMFGFVGSVGVSRYVSRSDMRTAPRYRRGRRRDAGALVVTDAVTTPTQPTPTPSSEQFLSDSDAEIDRKRSLGEEEAEEVDDLRIIGPQVPASGAEAAERYETGHSELEQAAAEVRTSGMARSVPDEHPAAQDPPPGERFLSDSDAETDRKRSLGEDEPEGEADEGSDRR
ncbi:monovalent cation/H+ antiporter complex subunit F [Brevibacterium album]|uniref:monovalent cation/H+ antiporter complex subunit F n=1 Tax=Brevibacterium album TaxID=417948 RepID=UPI0004160108|nr:monovalent cation/H+ antiporter complex subunit F [Brevibacterium album]